MARWTSVLRSQGVESNGIVTSRDDSVRVPILCSLPHAGERIPPDASWLEGLNEPLLFEDVDRYTDELYSTSLKSLDVAWVATEWHRYSGDLNRALTDVDQDAVEGAEAAPGTHARGLLWVKTTKGVRILPQPITRAALERIAELVYRPFHAALERKIQQLKGQYGEPILHLDLHSMPSRGTSEHRDPGKSRPDIVVSDNKGLAAARQWVDLIQAAAQKVGFSTSYNWPYLGGRITQLYGRPQLGVHTVQIELNRSLYMDEVTKQKLDARFQETQNRLGVFLSEIKCQLEAVRVSIKRESNP